MDAHQLDELLQPAMGYLQLGMMEEANDALEELPPELRAADEVLALRIEIFQRLERWESARVLAESLAKRSPENLGWWLSWSYALRREESVEAARAVMLEAAAVHPNEAIIPYNLACYACVLGQIEVARNLLEIAFGMDQRLKTTALDDPDLCQIFEAASEHPPPFVPPQLPESDP